jgi:transposase
MIMFQDEARFGLITDPTFCWVPPGCRPEAFKQITRIYTYVYGAVNPITGDADFVLLPTMETQCMNKFLRIIRKRYKNTFIVIFLDRAKNHQFAKNKKKGKLRVPSYIRLVHLPRCSPQLNPVEVVWGKTKPKIYKNRLYEDMNKLENEINEFYKKFQRRKNRKIIQNMTCFPWIKEGFNNSPTPP